ncbi:glutamate dehydrogenase [Coniochaeta sp. 2T2.1]|nr:glutamate dehydrogenase [Coniochaeta sp. 2T2.1]
MMGGGKGGADFDPKGKSDNEIRRFCVAFMRELAKHIGANIDVPAGDIGVGGREIGYMFGTYRKIRNQFEGVLTGKGLNWGGSLIRPEATGYGLVYYVGHMLEYAGAGGWAGKRVAISGSGNVAQYAALKLIELGTKVVSMSDSRGAIVAEGDNVVTPEDVEEIASLKLRRRPLTEFSHDGRFKYLPRARPWIHVGAVDVALPSATQNEVSKEEAEALVAAGCKFVAEGSNMGCTQEAIDVFEETRKQGDKSKAVWYAPGKAANCGGVAVSGLEMAQNSQRIRWSNEEVDDRLKGIMKDAFFMGLETAKKFVSSGGEDELPSLVAGSNIAGFVKVAEAMHDQGDWWA